MKEGETSSGLTTRFRHEEIKYDSHIIKVEKRVKSSWLVGMSNGLAVHG